MAPLNRKCRTYARPILPDIKLHQYATQQMRRRSSSFSISGSQMRMLGTFEIEECFGGLTNDSSSLGNIGMVLDYVIMDENDQSM